MPLRDHNWQPAYDSESRALIREFYLPALRRSVRYDRATGYFSASILVHVAQGLEALAARDGRMRLIVGCTLDEPEVAAIRRGEELHSQVAAKVRTLPLPLQHAADQDALELLSWMIAKNLLQVRLAIPCDSNRHPVATSQIFHAKGGVFTDEEGDRLAFNGSINESLSGWSGNWESFHVFCSWEASPHVAPEAQRFETLWKDQAQRCRVLGVEEAVRDRLLEFLPPNDEAPKQLVQYRIANEAEEVAESEPTADAWKCNGAPQEQPSPEPAETPETPAPPQWAVDWGYFWEAAKRPDGGERVGEATSAITPWPHQIRAFQRMYENWPPKLLIADEVGLGKTIEAGLLLRQAWLAGRAQRVLVLVPKAVLPQWQIELREKFNLNWPIYDGKGLRWYPSPALQGDTERLVSRQQWHEEPCVLVSSHLMRRRDRMAELLEAKPWDLVILDEAHHARRRGAGTGNEAGPNRLLQLMQRMQERTEGLILLTATPMQVHPVEVWDLLNLLDLPPDWHPTAFIEYFEKAAETGGSADDFEFLARLFRSVEEHYGLTSEAEAQRLTGLTRLGAQKLLSALRDASPTPRRMLAPNRRERALRLLRIRTPVSALISRHTRELLRRYHKAGRIRTRIASRQVQDDFVQLNAEERMLYEAVEDYISTTYNNAAQNQRNAVGFVMTIYHRRLASSFAALERTLSNRLDNLRGQALMLDEEDLLDDGLREEAMDEEEAEALEQEALRNEEETTVAHLLEQVRKVPADTKAQVLLHHLQRLRQDGYNQVIVFTQYTDTLDFLRGYLAENGRFKLLCYSGRGGEIPGGGGAWTKVSREETKRRFRNGQADVLLCTDAAAEGLNFQFCGALINYDMPWNPMKVEQRIGRIDRLGQRFECIRILNLHYEDTVETDVYAALEERIQLFSQFVGRLQPILSRLPQEFKRLTLASRERKEQARVRFLEEIQQEVQTLERSGFDLDEIAASDPEEVERPEAPYDWDDLRHSLQVPEVPEGWAVQPLNASEFQLTRPSSTPLRITTDPELFEQQPESLELWSPGCPVFPKP